MVQPAPSLPLTANCHHYTQLQEVPQPIRKYWKSRFSIFSNYDDGIVLTDDAWFGVTPEPVARQIALDILLPHEGPLTVVDLFAGAGGNTIAFALSGSFARIVSIERDADTLACAQANARIAGVRTGAITWVLGDCFEVLRDLRQAAAVSDEAADEPGRLAPLDPLGTVLFASPPWGGVDYTAQAIFDLSAMQPYNLRALHDACRAFPHALYLPRTSNLQQLADVLPRRRTADPEAAASGTDGRQRALRVIQYYMNGFGKALVAYYAAAEEE